ncbi:MAG: Ig-like domain-containing protein, partial [Verrucomicrobiota bacterium]
MSSGAANEAQTLVVSAASSNPDLIPAPSVSYVSPEATGSLSFAPVLNGNGSAVITVTVNDGGASNAVVSRNFTVTVGAVNTRPVAGVPGNQTVAEDTVLPLAGVSASDIDAGDGLMLVSLAAANGTLTLGSTTGLTVIEGANASPNLAVEGTLADLNPALATLSYLGMTDFNGSDTVAVVVNDQGNTGAGGPLSDSKSFGITVTAVNDVPVANGQAVVVVEDTAKAITLTGSDVEGSALSFSVVAGPGHGSLSGAAPNLTYTPSANYNGSDSFTFKANDGALDSAVATVSITVTAVNDPPTMSDIANQTINESAVLGPVAFTVGDIDTPPANLNLTVISWNPVLAPTANIVFGGSGENRTVTVTPTANLFGTATITVTVSDGFLSASDTFRLTVNALPTVRLTSPASDAQFVALANIVLVAEAADRDGSITRVEFYEGTTLIGADTSSPYSVTWNNVGAGAYSLTAKAADNGGATKVSDPLNVTVQGRLQLSGRVDYYGGGRTVPGVVLGVSGTETHRGMTAGDGTYSFALAPGGDYTVGPSQMTDASPNREVTTLDLLLIRKHVLGVASLAPPYQLLAADVNDSASVSTLDIGLIRQLIFLDTDTFPAGSWKFVRSDFVFSDPLQPWSYEADRDYVDLANALSGQDFMAIKLGDVNDSWTPFTGGTRLRSLSQKDLKVGPMDAGEDAGSSVSFRVGDKTATPGESVTVPVTVSGFTRVTTAQFTFQWDPAVLEFAGFGEFSLPGLRTGSFSTTRAADGMLPFSWDDPATTGVSLADGATILTLRFMVRGPAANTTLIRFGDNPTVREVTVNARVASLVSRNGSVTVETPDAPLVISVWPEGPEISASATAFNVAVPTISGRTYVLECTDSMVQPDWQPLTEVNGDGTVMRLSDRSPRSTPRFYRVLRR